jgi:hypothetical protein
MSKTVLQTEDQKKMKGYAQNATIIYSLLFPFLSKYKGSSNTFFDPTSFQYCCANMNKSSLSDLFIYEIYLKTENFFVSGLISSSFPNKPTP